MEDNLDVLSHKMSDANYVFKLVTAYTNSSQKELASV